MAKKQKFLDEDVLEMAVRRLHRIYDTHDSVAVCFSGGKDSLVALHLTLQVAREREEGLPIPVIFRDEELIPDCVIDFVASYRDHPDLDIRWYAVPLESNKFVLGQSIRYVQWDPAREHVRPIPEWAITSESAGIPPSLVLSQYDMDKFTAADLPGKVAFVTGIRASESLMRFRASVNKLNDSYINASGDARVSLCKPIYDWQENDIFKWLGESEVPYCAQYELQHYAGLALRVSTPIHAEAAKQIGSWRTVDPEFYDRVLAVFPEMDVQDRYWSSLDRKASKEKYGSSYEGVEEYIALIEDPIQRGKARRAFKKVMGRARRHPEAYPPYHLFTYIETGAFKRDCLPLGQRDRKKT